MHASMDNCSGTISADVIDDKGSCNRCIALHSVDYYLWGVVAKWYDSMPSVAGSNPTIAAMGKSFIRCL